MELVLLQRGAHGDTVQKLQEGLGVDADGKFGPGTEEAVRRLQEERGIEVDGIAGPATLQFIEGFGITEEQVGASVISEETPTVDPAAVEAAAAEEEPPHPEGVVARVEEKVVEVGKSIWNTVKRIL
jgi:peptidoglycan hydrolase-like protein with peptidoglycan-binding domain